MSEQRRRNVPEKKMSLKERVEAGARDVKLLIQQNDMMRAALFVVHMDTCRDGFGARKRTLMKIRADTRHVMDELRKGDDL